MLPRVLTSRIAFGVNQLRNCRLLLNPHIYTRIFLSSTINSTGMASNDSYSADEKFNLITRNLQVRVSDVYIRIQEKVGGSYGTFSNYISI